MPPPLLASFQPTLSRALGPNPFPIHLTIPSNFTFFCPFSAHLKVTQKTQSDSPHFFFLPQKSIHSFQQYKKRTILHKKMTQMLLNILLSALLFGALFFGRHSAVSGQFAASDFG
jgi:hypothetical protein